MTLEEIKSAIQKGQTVNYKNSGAEVQKTKAGQYHIVTLFNNYRIGLTWANGVTVNGKPDDFFIQSKYETDFLNALDGVSK